MRFLFLIQGLTSGGAEKQLLLTSRCLVELGHDCCIFTLASPPISERFLALIKRAESAGVKIVKAQRWEQSGGLHALRFARKVARAQDSVVWAWGLRATLVAKLAVGLNREARLWVSYREASPERMRKYARLERFRHTRVERFVNNSWRSGELLDARVKGALARTQVLWNALDDDETAQPAAVLPAGISHLHVGMLGNVKVQIKGYDIAVKVAERLKELRLPITIHVAGRDDAAGWLQNEIIAGGLGEQLVYAGETSQPTEFLRSKHAFLLLSRYEGMPNALLEAMNLGLPCISTRVGDVPRFATDRVNIRLTEIEDLEGTVRLLREFLQDWSQARALGECARSFCKAELSRAALKQRLKSLCDQAAYPSASSHGRAKAETVT